jgi:hypothetical protein
MTEHTAAGLARSRAHLAALAEICGEHADTCAVCAGHFKCKTAGYWAGLAAGAEDVALKWVQRARREELEAAS